jgi:histidine ammonia-lyase
MFNYGKDYLTAGKALQILRGQLPAQIDASTRRRIEENHRAVLDIARGDQAVYGINTGFGPLCNTIVDKKHTSELQRNLLLSHSVGVGGPIDREASKLMLILKLHALAMGFSGIALPILERIRWHIEEDLIPVVPRQGSVGASGDLAPLAHLFLPLLGEGQLYYRGKIRPTGEVFQKLGIAPVSMHPKAGLALINGTQFMGAHAVKLVEALYRHLAQ